MLVLFLLIWIDKVNVIVPWAKFPTFFKAKSKIVQLCGLPFLTKMASKPKTSMQLEWT